MQLEERTARTFRHERWRAVSAGILESAGTTFLLLIAVRWFNAGATAKALVAGGGSVGLVLSPVVVALVARFNWPAAQAASVLAALGSACFLVMALIPRLPIFVAGSIAAMTASA